MNNFAAYELGQICDYMNNRILHVENYISTENMLPNKSGICNAPSVPSGSAIAYEPGDILISNIRPYFQKIWRADRKGGCSPDVLCIRAKENTDSRYLYYLLSQQAFFDYVMAGAKGSKMPRGDKKQIMQWPVNLPPLAEQKRIAGILGAMDDKIELNRRINANLEVQVKNLYRQWFIDNPNPAWRITRLPDIATFIGGYSYKGSELAETSDIAMATIKNFRRHGGFKTEGFKDIIPSTKLKAEQHAELFDILVAHTDLTQNADVIGNAELLLTSGGYKKTVFSMDLVKVVPKENFPYKFLLATLLKNPVFKAHCIGYVNGTTVLHLSKQALRDYTCRIPGDADAAVLNKMFSSYYRKMSEILHENELLENLRNTLLPKLMNGEIKIE